MSDTYDWIVIGAGITGSALSYELAKQGFRVLLLEKDRKPDNATSYSYGGLAYWSGTDEGSRQLSQEGIDIYRTLTAELDANIEFRELDLLLTIDQETDPEIMAANYAKFAISPRLLSPAESATLEPLLNPEAISGALRFPHGHIHPEKTNYAYQQAFTRLGGQIIYETAQGILWETPQSRISAVQTDRHIYQSAQIVVCAGGLGRSLLKSVGIDIPLYFTHAQVIKTPPIDLRLSTAVMPANLSRFVLEAKACQPHHETAWQGEQDNIDGGGDATDDYSLDIGVFQFIDGSLCLGQKSEIIPNPALNLNLSLIEAEIRQGVARLFPALAQIRGTCHHCLVAFSPQSQPLIGEIIPDSGLYSFSGFTSTLLFAPPLARHFAGWVAGKESDPIVQFIKTPPR